MRPVHLDLLHRRIPPRWPAWAVLATGTLALAAVVGWDTLDAADAEVRRSAAEGQLSALRAAVAARQPAGVRLSSGQIPEEWKKAMLASANLNSPWSELFATLEREIGRPIGLLALDMDAARGNFNLSAEAKNFDEMLAFLRLLQESGHFSSVVLHGHQINQQDREKPIRFRITARWAGQP